MNKEVLSQPIGYSLLNKHLERRMYPRHVFNVRVQYRTEQMTYFEEGLIKNISQQGMLFLPLRRLELNSNIHVIIPPDQASQQPIRITAKVIDRIEHTSEGNSFYNCRIDQIEDPNVESSRVSGKSSSK